MAYKYSCVTCGRIIDNFDNGNIYCSAECAKPLPKNQDVKRTTPILRYFGYRHLPENLQKISKPVGELAVLMEDMLPDGPEKSAGLRKLLEAKDCFVRANL